MTLDVLRRPLPGLSWWLQRAVLRMLVLICRPWIEIRGAQRLAATPDPLIFAINHNNAYESLFVPAALIFERGGRPIQFLIDWMYLHIPIVGWLMRQIEPIPVYNKPFRWKLFESYRKARLGKSAVERCVERLENGHSVGIFPEGTRNRDLHKLRRGKKGLGRLVLRSEVSVVPVGIDFPARHRLGRMPKIGRIRIHIGEPLTFEQQRRTFAEAAAKDTRLEQQLSDEIVYQVMKEIGTLAGKEYPYAYPAHRGVSTVVSQADDPNNLGGSKVRREVHTTKVLTEDDLREAQAIIEEVYAREKSWVTDSATEIPANIAELENQSWFMVRVGDDPAGLMRITYDPPLQLPKEFKVELDYEVDLEEIARTCRFVEVGRFMIRSQYRRRIKVVLNLIKEAIREVVTRGYTHLLTDVFADDPNSPLHFHTRVLGFERIGTHVHGELNCNSVRIILVLDLARGYHQLAMRKNKVLQELSEGLREEFERLPQISWA